MTDTTGKMIEARALMIHKDVLDEVCDALEAAMLKTNGVHDELFMKLSSAHIHLDEAIQDAEATEP